MQTHLHDAFTAAVASLPQAERELITMYELEGATTGAAGGALGMSRSEARVTLLTARRAMRQNLTARFRAN